MERYYDLVKFYDKKATWDKYWYIGLKILESLLSAGITVCVGFLSGNILLRIFIACAGAALIVINAMHSVCRYHDNWRECRITCETLRREKSLFDARAAYYKKAPDNTLFYERIEEIVDREHQHWDERRNLASRKD